MTEFIREPERKRAIAAHILNGLPEWFGIPESTANYVEQSARFPFWAHGEGGAYDGFIVLRETSPYAAEIYVMGVRAERHRQGIGRELFLALYEYAKAHGYEYLQVKTVDEGCYEDYDRTRRFYESMGFRKLEVFPTLWDAHNPCLVMVMGIK